MDAQKRRNVINAVQIGVLCSVSYLAVYFGRNILSAVTPQMIDGGYSAEYVGQASSIFFITYGVGQLINGAIGDKIKARYMISIGLAMAGIANFLFPLLAGSRPAAALVLYGFAGLFPSMIFGPMTKVVAENTELVYATRCSLGYTFAAFFGSPLAGVAAAFMSWAAVFTLGSIAMVIMAVIAFCVFLWMEKRGVVRYGQYNRPKEEGGGIRALIRHRIIRFTMLSMITGVVRTTVVFWMPIYFAQYLGFSSDKASLIFTVATAAISCTAFISFFIYERLHRNMDLTIRLMFSLATVFFLLLYIIKQPVVNIILITLAVMSSNGAASMLWSRYCPSLRDTGMVSSATGFLDFVSYMAASVSSSLFANAISTIGWGNLIMIWCALMVLGLLIMLPYDRFIKIGQKRTEAQ